MIEIKKSICPYDCPSSCGLLMEVEDGRIIRVKNDPDHPVSRNGICRKMQHYEKSIYSDKRILTPLKRNGKKGSGDYIPISWPDAVAEITNHWKSIINENGPEAILPFSYSGVMSDIQCDCGKAFFGKMGASQLIEALCCPAKEAAYQSVAGKTGCLDPRELNDSDFYIIWGSNMAATRMQALVDLNKPSNRKKKKVLINTYADSTARHFDQVICIKAGTDGALALAMMHVLDKEGLVDEDFLQEYTEGYETLRKTLDTYTPEWAQKKTGIDAKIIRQLAKEYAAAKAPAIILGSGNSRYGNGGMTVRLIVILSLLTGAWRYPGGGLCGCTPINTPYVDMNLIRRPDFRQNPTKTGFTETIQNMHQNGCTEFAQKNVQVRSININQIASSLALKGKEAIRSLYVFGANPANTISNQDQVIKGLEREDLFTIVHDRFMTETAMYADIILPATFSVEHYDIYRCYGYCTLGTAAPVVKAPKECKSNWDTFCLLAQAMGYEEEYFKRTEKEMLDWILNHPTKAVSNLPQDKQQILREGGSVSMPYSDHLKIGTFNGKFQIVNEELAETVPRYLPSYGEQGEAVVPYQPSYGEHEKTVARYQPSCGEQEKTVARYLPSCEEQGETVARYLPSCGEQAKTKLHLVASPGLYSLNSEFRDRDDLNKKRGPQILIIHYLDAEERGIKEGQTVEAYNEQSRVLFQAQVTDQIARGNVVCEGVYRRDECQGGKAFNALTAERLSDMGEGTTLNDNLVEIIPYSL